MKYYEAGIYMMTELFVNNDPEQGCDPDTCMDNGLVHTIKADTLQQLKKDLDSMYDNIEHYEDNRYETGYETIERDGTHESVMVSIYITEVVKEVKDVNFEKVA